MQGKLAPEQPCAELGQQGDRAHPWHRRRETFEDPYHLLAQDPRVRADRQVGEAPSQLGHHAVLVACALDQGHYGVVGVAWALPREHELTQAIVAHRDLERLHERARARWRPRRTHQRLRLRLPSRHGGDLGRGDSTGWADLARGRTSGRLAGGCAHGRIGGDLGDAGGGLGGFGGDFGEIGLALVAV